MKKVILKSTLAVVAVAASCLGAWKTYEAYGSVDNSLLMQNIEALSGSGDSDGDNGGGDDMVDIRGNAIMKCWKRQWKETSQCDTSYHPQWCEITTYAFDGGTKLIYEKGGRVKRSIAKQNNLIIWNGDMGKCNYITSAKTRVNGTQPRDKHFHSCQPED